MKLFARKTPSPRPGTKVTCRPGVLRIENAALFGTASERWPAFIDRLAGLDEIATIDIDRDRGAAVLAFEPERTSLKALLERLGAALTARAARAPGAACAGLVAHVAGRRRFRLYRRAGFFSTFEVVHELPGRVRVRDGSLRGRSELVRRLELDLHTLPGVQTVTASATTGSVLVRFDPQSLDRGRLLAALDDAIRSSDLIAAVRNIPARASFTLANTTLAVATVGEFLFPAVLPVSAILLVATNVPSFRGMIADLRARQPGLATVQTAIVAGTLVTGGYLAASLMSWLLLFWQNRHARRVATARQILGAAVRKQDRTAWVVRDNVELETPACRLQPGDIIRVREGDMLPVDGKVVSGTALVDESVVRGTSGLVCRSVAQTILRGAQIVEGELRVEVTRCGDDTVAERIGQALDAATGHTALAIKRAPPPIARRAVSPTLLTAGLGLLVGDVGTAVAILRPDYATGPGIGGAMLLVHQLGTCLQTGVVVRQARVFPAMAEVDLLLVDDHRALGLREAEVASVTLRSTALSGDELLLYAERALRGLCDPRSRALAAACSARRLSLLASLPACQAGEMEFCDRGRRIRVAGLAAPESPSGSENDDANPDRHADDRAPPLLDVFCDGEPAGTIQFQKGTRLAAVESLFLLRTECGLQVGLLSAGGDGADQARILGTDFHQLCADDEARARYIADCRKAGHRVAYVGDCRRNPLAAAAADVSISLDARPGNDSDPSDVWVLQPDYGRIVTLRKVALASRRHSQMQHGMTLIPNLTCVAGAFFLGFTGLMSVIISNLGTYTVYRRSLASLRETERQLLTRRALRRTRRLEPARRAIESDRVERGITC